MSTLTASVLAAVRGRKKASRLEDDRDLPEEIEEEEKDAEGEKDETTAEEEDRDPDAEADDDEPTAEDDGVDPDADDEENQKQAGSAQVRRAEQTRIRSILMHPKADANPGLAAELAFGKRFYSAKEAGALLVHAGGGGGRLANRMKDKSPKIGSGPAPAASPKDRPSRIQAAAQQMIAAKKKR
ncbi:hypothetical protein [Chelativorans sp. YIM 93263]|uniref:hypothetical protein n=1 Tax=Chelativorans sp. YIM 93263 TaxID=2906648 RepID=UPI002379E60C|nr:hypothetical protein [Chelativorans sp. YIM 93263]